MVWLDTLLNQNEIKMVAVLATKIRVRKICTKIDVSSPKVQARKRDRCGMAAAVVMLEEDRRRRGERGERYM